MTSPTSKMRTMLRRLGVERAPRLVQPTGLGRAAEHLAAVLAQQHQVLDAHAAPAGQVDARLDAEHHAGPQDDLALAARHPRRLVDLQADPVAQAVAELLAVRSEERRVGKECRSRW